MFAIEFGTGQVLWSILWFFLFFLWIWLLITIFADIIRAKDMSGWAKAGWTILIIFLPLIGVLLYLVVNGDDMGERAAQQAADQERAFRSYVQLTTGTGGGTSTAAELEKLAALHSDGKIDDAEYEQLKAKILAS
jgi:hypothetical protein